MSHSHTHAPGEEHSHSHGPPQSPQSPMMPTPDPVLQAAIDQDFTPVPLALKEDGTIAVCAPHALEKCDDCSVDFVITNRLARILTANPNLLCPPPSNVVSQKLTQVVTTTKDEGNTLFKSGHAAAAISKYSTAAAYAVQRPPWEANQFMREELSAVISNRSAAFFEMHDYPAALADAETVITIRRNWSKGHFRKAKALLGLERFADAADAVKLGLSFEPTNQELLGFLMDIERIQQKREEKKQEASKPLIEAESAPATPVSA